MSDIEWLALAIIGALTVGFIAGFIIGALLMGKPDVLREMDRMEKDF